MTRTSPKLKGSLWLVSKKKKKKWFALANTTSRFLRHFLQTSQVKKDQESGACFAAPPGAHSLCLSLPPLQLQRFCRLVTSFFFFFPVLSQILWSSTNSVLSFVSFLLSHGSSKRFCEICFLK